MQKDVDAPSINFLSNEDVVRCIFSWTNKSHSSIRLHELPTITFILFPHTVCDWNILPEAVVRASFLRYSGV